MKRALAALVVACTAVFAVPASATPKPQITDPPGDTAAVVPSEDIVSGLIVATSKTITADLTLGAPPLTGVHTDYAIVFGVGCKSYAFDYAWNGAPQLSSVTFDEYACPTGDTVKDQTQTASATYPISVTNTANGVRFTAPVTKALHPGVKVSAYAVTRAANVIVVIGTSATSPTVGGDLAFAAKPFALGT